MSPLDQMPAIVCATVLLTVPFNSTAQEQPKSDATEQNDVFTNADEAARQSTNPLGGDFMIISNTWHVDFLQGDLTRETRNAVTHVFQPVVPIASAEIGSG